MGKATTPPLPSSAALEGKPLTDRFELAAKSRSRSRCFTNGSCSCAVFSRSACFRERHKRKRPPKLTTAWKSSTSLDCESSNERRGLSLSLSFFLSNERTNELHSTPHTQNRNLTQSLLPQRNGNRWVGRREGRKAGTRAGRAARRPTQNRGTDEPTTPSAHHRHPSTMPRHSIDGVRLQPFDGCNTAIHDNTLRQCRRFVVAPPRRAKRDYAPNKELIPV